MNVSRKSFLGGIAAFFGGLIPSWVSASVKKETFTVQVEDFGDGNLRAVLKTSGWPKFKISVLEVSNPNAAAFARLALMESIQKAMHIHLFPDESGAYIGQQNIKAAINGKQGMPYTRSVIKASTLFPDNDDGIRVGIRADIAESVKHIFNRE